MGWFAVMTKCQREDLAKINLDRQGYKTFYPYYIQWTTPRKTKPRAIKKPYLTRYIFVHYSKGPLQSFYSINNTIGVASIVYTGQNPLCIPDEIISEIKGKTDEDGRVYMKTRKPQFPGNRGDRIKFKETSPLFGFIGEIQRVDKGGRLMVQLDCVLGSGREFNVATADVDAVIKTDGPLRPNKRPTPR